MALCASRTLKLLKLPLRPILKLMPGGLERYLGPAFYDMVGKFAGKKLMIAMQSLPYFMGFVFRSILYLFGDFYGIQWANIIGGFHPEANVEKQMGALDMSHDASQDRMDRVYRGKSECKSSVTTGCPTAIPVRAGYVYGERSGDVTGSAYDTLYAGRQHLKVHTATVQPAYINGRDDDIFVAVRVSNLRVDANRVSSVALPCPAIFFKIFCACCPHCGIQPCWKSCGCCTCCVMPINVDHVAVMVENLLMDDPEAPLSIPVSIEGQVPHEEKLYLNRRGFYNAELPDAGEEVPSSVQTIKTGH